MLFTSLIAIFAFIELSLKVQSVKPSSTSFEVQSLPGKYKLAI